MNANQRPYCIYAGCKKQAVGIYPRWRTRTAPPGDPGDWPLCEVHSKQKAHPRDIDMRRFEPFEKGST